MMTSVTTPPAPELYKVRRIPDVSRHYVLWTIPIQSGRVLITDPGYEEQVGCSRILECVSGNYEVLYTKDADEYMMSLGIFHPDFKTVEPNELIPPYLSVDTARISFSDASHKVPLCEGDFYFDQVAVVDWHGTPVAICDIGADGGYPLLVARDSEGRIIAAEVLFESTVEDDDDDE
jgi:hypothetical protein